MLKAKQQNGLGLLEVILSLLILTFLIAPLLNTQKKSLEQRNLIRPQFDLATGDLQTCQLKEFNYFRVIICQEKNFPKLEKYVFF